MARRSLLDRFRRRPAEGAGESAPPTPPRAQRMPAPGVLRRERRALVRTREERIRDLGGLMLEMYRRDRFKQDLLVEQCLEVISIEERLREIDSLLEASVAARPPGGGGRWTSGAPPGGRRSLHVRRTHHLGVALLRQLRAPRQHRAGRFLPELRERASRRRTVLCELRDARAGRFEGPGESDRRRRADDASGRALGRSLGELDNHRDAA